ncbi:MAG: hypothetical protein GY749_17360 [Desulfobacteraceae bacterium]|nr:hypothetical protein [Desulfobacteraceae bacterium]
MKTVRKVAAGIFIFQIIVSTAAADTDPKEYVKSILSQNVHPGEPHKHERIRMYCKRTGVSVDEIGKILVQFSFHLRPLESTSVFPSFGETVNGASTISLGSVSISCASV